MTFYPTKLEKDKNEIVGLEKRINKNDQVLSVRRFESELGTVKAKKNYQLVLI